MSLKDLDSELHASLRLARDAAHFDEMIDAAKVDEKDLTAVADDIATLRVNADRPWSHRLREAEDVNEYDALRALAGQARIPAALLDAWRRRIERGRPMRRPVKS